MAAHSPSCWRRSSRTRAVSAAAVVYGAQFCMQTLDLPLKRGVVLLQRVECGRLGLLEWC